MRAYLPFLVGIWSLSACGNQGFNYLTRPGNGTTGSTEETSAYYAAMQDHLPEKTLTEWRKNRCFTEQNEISAFYYNASDLGLGREMRCAQCPSADDTGAISCVVSNHGVPQGLDLLAFQRERTPSIQNAFTQLEDFLAGKRQVRGASVAMDFDPRRPPDEKVRFYIYDASDMMLFSPGNTTAEGLIPGLQLDGEGGAFNQGVKFMRNCLSCHGGKYDPQSNRILGSSFLDFDISLFAFSDDPVLGTANANRAKRSAANLDNLRKLNALVKKVDLATGAQAIVARIDGSYSGPVEQITSQYIGTFVPAGWPETQVVRTFNGRMISAADFFRTVVHPYCATCHFSQAPKYNLSQVDSANPLTFSSFEQWFANKNIRINPDGLSAIRQDACGSLDMPHAEVTRNNLLRDPTALSYICN